MSPKIFRNKTITDHWWIISTRWFTSAQKGAQAHLEQAGRHTVPWFLPLIWKELLLFPDWLG
jgi:hypothetical protein